MERIIEMLEKNQAITAGETFVYNGEKCEVPGMTDEEIETMIADGNKIGDIEIEIKLDGEMTTIKLIDMKDGRKLFKRIEAMNLDGNINAFWYVWRLARIEEKLQNMSESKRNKVKQILGL